MYRKMKNILIIILVTVSSFCYAGNFRIDSITFHHVLYMDCESCSHPDVYYEIPQVKTDNPNLSYIADSINAKILKTIDFDTDLDAFTSYCHGVNYRYAFEGDYVLLDLDMVGYGAHGDVDYDESLLFDLRTGDMLTFSENSGISVPFAYLFSLDGYYEFLNSRNWDKGVFEAFLESYTYREEDGNEIVDEDYVFAHAKYAQFHIDYSFDTNVFYFWREYVWYADFCYAERCFEPYYGDECSINQVKPYLNKLGKIMTDNKKSRIGKTVAAIEFSKTMKNRLFFEVSGEKCTKQDGSEEENEGCEYVPYKVAIDYSNPNKITGYVFIGDRKEKITGHEKDGYTYLKSKQSNWEFSFSEEAFNAIFWSKERGEIGRIVGCNEPNDPY